MTVLAPTAAIRPFEEGDYEGFAALLNAVDPEHPTSAEELRRGDGQRDPAHRFARFVATGGDGRVVGSSGFGHMAWAFDPHRFSLSVNVHPEARGRGLGRRLFENTLAALQPLDPAELVVWAREDETGKVTFFERRGFREVMRGFESRLFVPGLDLSRWPDPEARMREAGVEVRTYAELVGAPGFMERLHALYAELDRDVPGVDPITEQPLERLRRDHEESPNLLPEAYFVALKEEELVGLHALWRSQSDPDLHNGLTGVRRPYRRLGLATALKLRGVRYAREHGYDWISTWNASINRPMLSINEAMGFEKRPATLELRKRLADG